MDQEKNSGPYNVIWREARVGSITDTIRDMWNLEGTWLPDETEKAVEFETLARSLDIRKVYSDWSKGTRVIMEIPGSTLEQIHSVVLGMEQNVLVLRNVFDPEAVQWLMQHVQ